MTDFRFRFDGRAVPARAGDTIAAALYRAGVRVFSRSFKYHRPRGLLCVAGRCPNCLVAVDGTPNVRACVTPAEPGMVVRHVNAWPSLALDLLAVNDALSFLLPPGFYYKTFIRPRFLWPLYETVLRHAAGLSPIDIHAHPDERYEEAHRHPDVLVVGGGPAGLAAARAAGDAGSRVLLVDEQPALGGHTRWSRDRGEGWRGQLAALRAAVTQHDRIEGLTGAVVFGIYEGQLAAVMQGRKRYDVRWRELVVATGRYEFPALFAGNDTPGVMLGSGVQRLLRQDVTPGTRAVVATANPYGYEVAADLLDAGVRVEALADARPGRDGSDPAEGAHLERVRGAGVPILLEHSISAARRGWRGRLTGAVLSLLDAHGRPVAGRGRAFACDLVAVSTGFQTDAALLAQSGGALAYAADVDAPLPAALPPHVQATGFVNGMFEVEAQLLEGVVIGERAGAAARGAAPASGLAERERRLERLRADGRRRAATRPPAYASGGGKAVLCPCEDVTPADVAWAVAEGFDHIELLKRYLTISMGPCQGKMCARGATALCAVATGQSVAATGTTTARPPVHPVPFGVLAGSMFEPVQRTAMHRRHEEAGAEWMDAGTWKRPKLYTTAEAECRAVRERVGIIDVSTLGKLDVRGTDAARLLEKVYTHKFANLKIGRVRYGVAADDSGIVLDDGTICRLADERYFVTTTTSGIAQMEAWMTWWLAGTGWCAHVTNVTSAYAAVNLAGPRARDVLTPLTDLDVSAEAMPYLAGGEGMVAGIPTLILRIGFVGELGYEMHFPADYGEAMWDALLAAGKPFGIQPFGIEAQRILRLEKGHIIVTQDTDALSTVLEADMAWAVKFDKGDFVGKRALAAVQRRGLRQKLVGFEVSDGPSPVVPEEGDQVVDGRGWPVGRVSSARFSHTLAKPIGLAWVPADWAAPGSRFTIHCAARRIVATVVPPPFYDPDGARMKS